MVNSWWEIQVLAALSLDELVFWRLEKFGCHGTASQTKGSETWVRAYLPIEKATLLDMSALALLLEQDALALGYETPIVKWDLINEEDWSNSWKQHWQPQEIGEKLIIYPAWISPTGESDRKILRLDPGSAFGTGAHATTQLCLEALEMRMSGVTLDSGFVLADVGCGSGILGIGALLLGASKIYAVDTDIMAVKATHHNRKLNNIAESKIWVEEGSLGHLLKNLPEPVDGFVCNILADVIVDMIPYFHQLTKPDGWGVLSGLLLDQSSMVIEVLEEHKWIAATLWKQKDWCCITVRKS